MASSTSASLSGGAMPVSQNDGNAEGEDLVVPLPVHWDVEALQGMRVVLYQNRLSPPCCKMRFLLSYYKVPFQTVDGKKPGSTYTKIPVLDIGDRQINDSYIMVKSLAPVLQGRPLTDDELELENQVTFGLMIALEKEVAGSVQDLCNCANFMGGCMGCVVRTMSCIVCCVAPRKIGAGKTLLPVEGYGDLLRDHLAAGQYFGGGDKPSVVDLSVFGVIEPFARAECKCVSKLLGPPGDPLRAWHDRMRAATRHVDIFESSSR